MMYLEDFLDKLDFLPETMRTKLTEMRELDLRAANSMNKIKKDVDDLFSNAKEMDPDELNTTFEAIMKRGEVPLEASDKKIQLADDLQSFMSKCINELNKNIEEFSEKLESNFSSVHQINEKDQLNRSQQSSILSASSLVSSEHLFSPGSVDLQMASSSKTLDHSVIEDLSPSGTKTLPADTQQSFEISESEEIELVDDFDPLLTGQIHSASNELLLKSPSDNHLAENRQIVAKNRNEKEQSKCKETQTSQEATNKDDDEHAHADKPQLYCICNQVSFGAMVACDRRLCSREWFHFGCVGLTSKPKGKWYCPPCAKKLKKRSHRHY